MEVRRVDQGGGVGYGGRRLFVCEALAGEWVGCQVFDHHVLVTFRHLAVRELDLRSGRTRPLVAPAPTP